MFRTSMTLRTKGDFKVRSEEQKRPQILGLEEGLRNERKRMRTKDLLGSQPR